jgi:hypothetical protein
MGFEFEPSLFPWCWRRILSLRMEMGSCSDSILYFGVVVRLEKGSAVWVWAALVRENDGLCLWRQGYFKEKSFRGLAEELSLKIRGVEMSREVIELEDTREEEDVCVSVQLKNWDMCVFVSG